MTRFALLPSPLLGPAVWLPVAAELTSAGHVALVSDLGGRISSPADVLAGFLASVPEDDSTVLVGHSNAGLYLPAVADSRDVPALIFADAALPPATGGREPAAAPEFLSFLAAKADGRGLLPPWSEWWEEDLAHLFPDEKTRQEVEREQQRLPLSYFEDTVDVPGGWDARPCAYLAFGDTYAMQTAMARARGWPVMVLEGQHLEMLIRPALVARQIAALLAVATEAKGME